VRYDDIKQPRRLDLACSICARPATDAHHINHKGMGGRGAKATDADDATPLCRDCHDAHHAGNLTIIRDIDGVVTYTPKNGYERTIRRRGVHCIDGGKHAALYEGDTMSDIDTNVAPDDGTTPADGDFISQMDAKMREIAASDVTVYRYKALYLAEIRESFKSAFAGRDALARFRRWRHELTDAQGRPMPITDATTSRLLLVADVLGDTVGAGLKPSMQVALAQAMEAGKTDHATLLADAAAMSTTDFEILHGLREEPKPAVGRCPACAYEDALAAFKKGE
jgi:hypothetical protein